MWRSPPSRYVPRWTSILLIGCIPACNGHGTELDAHRRVLTDAGCGQVVEEQPRAEDIAQQPELDILLGRLRPGDVPVVPQLDSLARSLLPDLVRTPHCGALQPPASACAAWPNLSAQAHPGERRRMDRMVTPTRR